MGCGYNKGRARIRVRTIAEGVGKGTNGSGFVIWTRVSATAIGRGLAASACSPPAATNWEVGSRGVHGSRNAGVDEVALIVSTSFMAWTGFTPLRESESAMESMNLYL